MALPFVLTCSAAVLAQAWVSAWLFTRRRPSMRLVAPADAWGLTGAALAGSVVGALVAAAPVALGLGDVAPTAVLSWVVRMSTAVVAAGLWLLLADSRTDRAPVPARWGELVLVNLGALGLFVWLFDVEHVYSLAFLTVPVTVWIGVRFPLRVAAATTLAVTVLDAVISLHGLGAFASAPPAERVLAVQLMVALMTLLTLMLGLQRDDRGRLVENLRAARQDAEGQADLLRTVFATTSDGMSVYAADATLLMANAAAGRLYPRLPDGVPTERFADYVEVLDAGGAPVPGARMPLVRALSGERIDSDDMTFRNLLDGSVTTVNVAAHGLPHSAGASWSGGAIIAFRDVTAQRAAAAEVARAHDVYAGILSGATEQLIVAADLHGTVTVVNEGARRLLGVRADAAVGGDVCDLLEPAELAGRALELDVRAGAEVLVEDLRRAGGALTRHWTLRRHDGAARRVALTTSWLLDPDGRPSGILAIGTDVTEQVAVQDRLADSESRFRTAFDTAPVGMLLVGVGSAAGRILQVNATMTEFTGLVPEELGILDVHAIVPWADRDEFARNLDPLLDGAVTDAQFEHRYLRADGGSGWGRTTATRVVPGGSSPGSSPATAEPYLLCLVEDVTARKAAESALVHQAQHDALTGLPNRVLLRERLEAALHDAATGGGPVGVLVIDLDGFKAVNDSAGHAAGDALLREVASRLASLTRAEDTVARLGGDEFAVVCPGTDAADLERLGRRVLDAVREPVVLPGGTVTVGVSVGSAVHDRSGDSAQPRDGGTPDRLLQNADLAMYAAKRAGKNRSFAYDHRDRERLDRAERLLPELAAAVGAGEFEVFGQPIVDLGSGRVDAVETLLRWRRADGTVLAPGAFLDVLEASPLMPAVGEFVLRTSCDLAAQWERALGAGAPAVHVNVSAEQLGGSLAEQVDRVLAQTGLSAHLLVLELTETHTTRITDALLGELETVRARGVRIAIDDLGTGYSGLARLTELPVDLLKIDLQFVAGLGRDRRCDAVVRAVLGIGRALGMQVVAEGVETAEQADLLRAYGATTAQGYRFARPVPAADLPALLARVPLGV